MKSINALLALLAVVTVAGCNGSEPPPPCMACPTPEPSLPLAWTDVPEGPTAIPVGEQVTLTVRLSSVIDAEYSFGTTTTNIAVTSTVTRTGVVDVTIVALEVGEATVNLVAEAPGYEIARASFDVVVERKPLFGEIVEGFIACRELEDMDEILEFFQAGVEQEIFDAFLFLKVTGGKCGIFEDGDPIRWDGAEVLRPITGELARELETDSLSVIQVWGSPLVGFEPFSRAPQERWWIWRIFTTFHEGPRPSATLRLDMAQR